MSSAKNGNLGPWNDDDITEYRPEVVIKDLKYIQEFSDRKRMQEKEKKINKRLDNFEETCINNELNSNEKYRIFPEYGTYASPVSRQDCQKLIDFANISLMKRGFTNFKVSKAGWLHGFPGDGGCAIYVSVKK